MLIQFLLRGTNFESMIRTCPPFQLVAAVLLLSLEFSVIKRLVIKIPILLPFGDTLHTNTKLVGLKIRGKSEQIGLPVF